MKTCRGPFTGSPSAHNSPADHIPYFPRAQSKTIAFSERAAIMEVPGPAKHPAGPPRINRYGMEKNNV